MTTPVSDEDFARIVRLTPLVSIDIVVRDPHGAVLLGLRRNEPAKGFLFVPGGRIRKDETLDDAFARILAGETGIAATRAQAHLLGVYQHFYDTNRFGTPDYGTHYVVTGYELTLRYRPQIRLDAQHGEACWMTQADILASPTVHENTKAYFR